MNGEQIIKAAVISSDSPALQKTYTWATEVLEAVEGE